MEILSFSSTSEKTPEYKEITALCLGHFDGIHLAHQKLFDRLGHSGGIFCIGLEFSLLTPYDFRKQYTNYPIFACYLKDIKHLGADEFLSLLKNVFPNLSEIIVGYDFKMGYQKSCDVLGLQRLFRKVVIIDEVKVDGVSVHSRVIKENIAAGHLQKANKLLGRTYQIKGEIITGQGLGKDFFVPTINILNNYKFLLPQYGVYLTRCFIENRWQKSISFLGHRVTTDGSFAIETFILDKSIVTA